MKYATFILFLAIATVTVQAQQVPRRAVAEHFTNSWCSVCANRNPGFYQNLTRYPQILHLSVYPSAPYPGCPLNQYNKAEQDARTNYYSVYGSTPRLVISGTALSTNANYNDSAIFKMELDSLSSFDAAINVRTINAGTGEAQLTIYKRAGSSLDSLWLYAVLAQDTLNFTANNGETHHYDVFKKSIWGVNPIKVALPVNIGDSLSYSSMFSIDPAWPNKHIVATAMLQRDNKRVEQAARSGVLVLPALPTAVPVNHSAGIIGLYPNPAGKQLHFTQPIDGMLKICDLWGRIMIQQAAVQLKDIDVSSLEKGYYFIKLQTSGEIRTLAFIKE